MSAEPQQWSPLGAFGVRADRADRVGRTTYASAVPPRIAGATPRLPSDIVTAAEDAVLALTRLDSELGASLANFAPVLLRSEAASSSQIENLTASARSILRAELGARTGGNAALVAANVRALRATISLADDLTEQTILAMHGVLMEGQVRHAPGRWRTEPVRIGRRTDSPIGADFVAPHQSHIAEAMADLVRFMSRTDLPTLVTVALTHAQFETIHPFTDGNGRTGRALAQAQLRHLGATRNVALPVSAGLLADVAGYHDALTAARSGDPAPIVSAFAAASLRAVDNTRMLVDEIERIRERWTQVLAVRRSSNAWRLLDVLVSRPVVNSRVAAEELGVQQPNVYPPLRALEDAGIVTKADEYRLGPSWRADEILDALDRFAERAGRRSLA